ncbi:hypothetical protein BCR44DRAFT_36473 [Catenaria anguillulae PL171]|uniref:Uncharacterized protein n=1 Tax=Catenaria anguillulae PL171 TaxID=765915 RepID=A0A1Y2HA83_9FUNG|nr:hypothetical protein BCR44DRAFT_36473 [Catenaria anguillulae PL171]
MPFLRLLASGVGCLRNVRSPSMQVNVCMEGRRKRSPMHMEYHVFSTTVFMVLAKLEITAFGIQDAQIRSTSPPSSYSISSPTTFSSSLTLTWRRTRSLVS